jgi:F-type H+-transporting ATPase subunit gamma
MPGTKEIKRRIKSIKNTKKITKAMELVAASKMKRAVSSTLSSRSYAEYSWEILTSMAEHAVNISHPLFIDQNGNSNGEKENKKTLFVVITSNRGLCGSYNAQIIKKSLGLLKEESDVDIVAIGKKGDVTMRRIGVNVKASFFELPDNLSIRNITPISEMLIKEYNLGNYAKIMVAYTDFVSALIQKPNIKQLIPIKKSVLKEFIEDLEALPPSGGKASKWSESKIDYLFEGDMKKLIETLSEKIIRMQIYQMILESNASEQSARMMAMKNASDAGEEMIEELTLVFNKARQSNITREISEISAGMASV